MKTNAIVRIVLFSLAILVLLGILLAGLAANLLRFIPGEIDNDMDTDPIVGGNLASSGIVDAAKIKEIEIEWVSGSITIQPGDTDSIEFSESEVTKEKYKMVWKQSGSTLKIQYCKDSVSFPSFGINVDVSKDLVITVPQDWVCDSLEIDAASATVNISNMTISEMEFDGASGACTFENCAVGELSMDTVSGDVDFSGTLNVLDFDGASASCRIQVTNVPNMIDIDTASGDLDLYLPEECGFSCKLTSMSGNFTSDYSTTTQNGHHVYGDGSCRINVDAMSGDVSIRKHTGGDSGHDSGHHSE